MFISIQPPRVNMFIITMPQVFCSIVDLAAKTCTGAKARNCPYSTSHIWKLVDLSMCIYILHHIRGWAQALHVHAIQMHEVDVYGCLDIRFRERYKSQHVAVFPHQHLISLSLFKVLRWFSHPKRQHLRHATSHGSNSAARNEAQRGTLHWDWDLPSTQGPDLTFWVVKLG